jgi:putative phage-type endonuclease
VPDVTAVDDLIATVQATSHDTHAAIDAAQPMPTAVLAGKAPDHSEAWHGMRSRGIGGSEVAAILGLSPWQSAFSLWHTKRAGWVSEPNDEQRWGTAIEPALINWWFDEHQFRRYGVQGGSYHHRSRRWQLANPDAVAQDDDGHLVVVEAKKAPDDETWGEPGTDQVPPHYRTQAVHYMDTLGIPLASFVVSKYGRAPVTYWVHYDPEEARLIRGHAAAFWRSLQHDQAPELDGHAATYQAVRRLHPDIDGTDVEVDPWTAVEWRIAKRRLDRAQHRHRQTAARLLDAMGPARRAFTPDGSPVARRQPARGGSIALYDTGSKP